MKITKDSTNNLWAITHGVVIDNHWGYATTNVRAETAEKALSLFNETLANNRWTQKARIGDVEQLIVYKQGTQ